MYSILPMLAKSRMPPLLISFTAVPTGRAALMAVCEAIAAVGSASFFGVATALERPNDSRIAACVALFAPV